MNLLDNSFLEKINEPSSKIRIILITVSATLIVGSITLLVSYQRQSNKISLVSVDQIPSQSSPEPTSNDIYVDISGAITNPGIYILEEGDRVNDLVVLAGGISIKSDAEWVQKTLNLAERLSDGQKIYIPFLGEYGQIESEYSEFQSYPIEEELVNINTSSQSTIEKLPGIGPSTSKKIILFREQYGDFSSIESIKNVPGIGETTFDDIKDLIVI